MYRKAWAFEKDGAAFFAITTALLLNNKSERVVRTYC